jgi:2-polyprenyl-3-methyl-5-hydroxy-6-metoxy-1,4-benzoquinol methylase
LDVYGIDYTEIGCEQTKAILKRDNVQGEIILADIFNPPHELLGAFDYVCSFGVAEHFDDTTSALNAFSKFLKPGGILITSIPNMAGIIGLLQKWMYKEVYDVHKIMSKDQLASQFDSQHLQLLTCNYFLPVSFGLTLDPVDNTVIKFRTLKKLIAKGLQIVSKVLWKVDDLLPLPNTTLFSAGIFTVAQRNK